MKVFTSRQFVDKLKWLVSLPTHYSSQYWSVFRNGKWEFDCLRSIKAILWNFSADKSKSRGGTVYKSNGVADFTCNGGLNYCTNVSKDFTKLVPGSYLCMKGTKYNHSGICLEAPTSSKRGKVFECTTGWGTKKCIISEIDTKGNRYYNGVKNVPWTWNGLLIYIDYTNTPSPTTKTVEELAQEVLEGKWGNGEDRKKRLESAGYNYRQVQDRVNELVSGKTKKYVQLTANVWCRLKGYGFKYAKYKVISNNTKCELITKNIGKSDGYNWDKVIYNDNTVYLPNKWNKYL